MFNPDDYCPLPFAHLEIQPSGDVFVCCHSLEQIPIGNLHKNSLEEIWNSDEVLFYQEQFKAGKGATIKHCESCFKLENENALSGRQREIENYQKMKIDIDYNQKSYPLKSLAIRFSNVCNLKCRTCRPSTSTAWFEDAKKLKPEVQLKQLVSSPNSNPLSKQIRPFLEKDLQFVYFAGGEPLIAKDHLETLDSIIEINPNCKVMYDTNLSGLGNRKEKILEKWKQLNNLYITVSLDGSFERGEYLRSGLVWSEIIENWNYYKTNLPNAKFGVHMTVSLYNVLHMFNFLEDLKDLNGMNLNTDFIIGICEEPKWLNIRSLSPSQKEFVLAEYSNYINNCDEGLKSQLMRVVNYIKTDIDRSYLMAFKSFTQKLDNIRSENFKKTFPEIVELINK